MQLSASLALPAPLTLPPPAGCAPILQAKLSAAGRGSRSVGASVAGMQAIHDPCAAILATSIVFLSPQFEQIHELLSAGPQVLLRALWHLVTLVTPVPKFSASERRMLALVPSPANEHGASQARLNCSCFTAHCMNLSL
jgi:hypothetical protein